MTAENSLEGTMTMAMVEPTNPNDPANFIMGRNPIVGAPYGGEMQKPTLPEGILPLYLAKVHPEAMAAAGEAGAAAVAAMPPPVQEIANVDEPREEAPGQPLPPWEGQPAQPLPPWEGQQPGQPTPHPQPPVYQRPQPNQPTPYQAPAPYQAPLAARQAPTPYQPPR
jgi:hypothetical protein